MTYLIGDTITFTWSVTNSGAVSGVYTGTSSYDGVLVNYNETIGPTNTHVFTRSVEILVENSRFTSSCGQIIDIVAVAADPEFEFTGTNYEQTLDSGILNPMQGLTNGIIEFDYKTTLSTEQAVISLTDVNTVQNDSNTSININRGIGEAIQFVSANPTQYFFFVSTLAEDYFYDGAYHSIKLIIDGINNRFIIDGVTYEDTDITFSGGTKTTNSFMPSVISNMNVGRRYVIGAVGQLLDDWYCVGTIKNLKIKNVAETVTYYEFPV